MKKRLKKGILAIVLAVAATFCVSCASNDAMEDILEKYPLCVTIDFNGGKEGENESKRVQVAQDSLLFEPNKSESVYKPPEKTGYTIEGYYLGTKDENGNITFGKKWDFKLDRVTEDTTLYVKWYKKLRLVIMGAGDVEETELTTADLDEKFVVSEWTIMMNTLQRGYTFKGFYRDKDCTQAVTGTIDCSAMESDFVVYAKYERNS